MYVPLFHPLSAYYSSERRARRRRSFRRIRLIKSVLGYRPSVRVQGELSLGPGRRGRRGAAPGGAGARGGAGYHNTRSTRSGPT
ncbi:hypothetical protein EVAR_36902_1 [Eumeta japonica]|uniref:Uncharacterized protein n=1 Tax=Eumeta variegata TaxID=151549 RepID=A0A4C1WUW7_EUMVA|nr:hypothetical protein EVAR_36902_1 [Eumeta japonica]